MKDFFAKLRPLGDNALVRSLFSLISLFVFVLYYEKLPWFSILLLIFAVRLLITGIKSKSRPMLIFCCVLALAAIVPLLI